MKKLYRFHYFILVFVLSLIGIKVSGQSSSAYYFRTVKSGVWDNSDTWESSPDGISWSFSASVPTSDANTITIRNGHSVTVSNSTTIDEVVVAGGGVLEIATSASSVLTVHNGLGPDITVQKGGVFKHNASSLPAFASLATLEIQSGGILEAANNINGIGSEYAAAASLTASHVLWNDSSIFHWNNPSNPADGVNYFPASAAIPIFRVSQPVTIGGAAIINGVLEANANVLFQGSEQKTLRNGITGTGKVGVTAVTGGQFFVNGATAALGGSGILELNNNGLLISNGTALTLTSDKTINNFSSGTGSITNAGTMILEKYTINGNSRIKIDGTVKTANINGLTGGTKTAFATGFTVNTLGSSSVIDYNASENQNVTPIAYSNLTISGIGTKTAAAGADIYVSGTLNIAAGNTFTLNGTNDLKLNGGGTVNINTDAIFDNGGESQISGGGSPTINIYGTFITRDKDGFIGLNTSIPGITPKIFSGSTIEYGRVGDQAVTPTDDYKNITFSGSGTKTIPKCRPIGTVTIKDNVIADFSNKTFGDTTATNLVMTGGRLKVGGTGTKPDIAGTYNLTGGVIEFTNSGLTKETIRSPITYMNIEVSGSNVLNSSGITHLANGGSFTVKTGGNFENSGRGIDGTDGIQTFTMEPGSTFTTAAKGGLTGLTNKDSASLTNIENLVISPKSTIVYNRKGNQIITPLAAHPSLLLKGSGTKTVASGTLTIAATADSLIIDTAVVLKINAGAKVDFQNRPVIFHSNAGGTGMIGEITDASALLNATDITIERFIPARRAFRFLSTAVTTSTSIKANWMEGVVNPNRTTRNNPNPGYGTNITGKDSTVNGFDPTASNNPSLFTFNMAAQKWEAVLNTNSTLTAGSAYRLMVRGDRSIDMTNNNPEPKNTVLRTRGKLFTGAFSPTVSPAEGYYTFIGNPYASAINWNTLTRQDISTTYYTWDPNLNYRGAYATYNGSLNVIAPTGTKIDRNIQPGQAFFVRTTKSDMQSPNSVNPVLTIKEANKTNINNPQAFRPVQERPRLSIQLLLNTDAGSENIADAAVAFFDDNFSSAISNEDSYKFTNLDENMAINRDGVALSIEGRATIAADDTIALKMWQLAKKQYYLKLDGSNFMPDVTAFAKDDYLHTETPVDLASVSLLPFTIDTAIAASYASNRFSIIFKSINTLPVSLTDIKAYQKGEGIQVEWTANTEINIDRYEIEKSADGVQFAFAASVNAKDNSASIKKYDWFDASPNPGNNYYRIKIIEKSGEVKYSEITTVKIKKADAGITISPNPVRGNIISLQLSSLEKGKYSVNLYNNLGQKFYNSLLTHAGNSASYKIDLGRLKCKGVYKFTISKEEKTFVETIIFE